MARKKRRSTASHQAEQLVDLINVFILWGYTIPKQK